MGKYKEMQKCEFCVVHDVWIKHFFNKKQFPPSCGNCKDKSKKKFHKYHEEKQIFKGIIKNDIK